MTTDEIIEGELLPDVYEKPAVPGLFGTDDPDLVIVKAVDVSNALARVIRDRKLYARISGKEHVLVGGWTLLGSMLGVYPVTVWSRPLEDGWEARVEARTRDGAIVGAGESECLRSERRWAKADDYAIRSMAQTRATSRALKLTLGFVMELAGFDATPADEIPAADDVRREEPRARGEEHRVRDPIPDEIKPTDEQREEVLALLRSLKRIEPERDWAARCKELAGVDDWNMITRTTAKGLTERLQAELRRFADEPEAA